MLWPIHVFRYQEIGQLFAETNKTLAAKGAEIERLQSDTAALKNEVQGKSAMILQVHEQMAALKAQNQEIEETERRTTEVREQFWHQKQKVSDMDLQVRKHKSAKRKAEDSSRALKQLNKTLELRCDDLAQGKKNKNRNFGIILGPFLAHSRLHPTPYRPCAVVSYCPC